MPTHAATTATSQATSQESVAAANGRDRQVTAVAMTHVIEIDRHAVTAEATTTKVTGDLQSVATTNAKMTGTTTDATTEEIAKREGHAAVTASTEMLATAPAATEEKTAWTAAEVLLRTEAGMK